ncbi:MAG: enoyl-CoA hydratase/isomerase family protein [Beijerinckiaceae bacterium]|nr:enoyl-CoA hydratase/isomerase family protein [Beijerinckiaceae bacterium]
MESAGPDLRNFRFETGADGVALLTWDMDGRSMNVITADVMDELRAVIDKVAGDAAIKGCVIVSGKDSFSGGADLAMLQAMGARFAQSVKREGQAAALAAFMEESRSLSALYRRLETCGKPFAIAIHGVCLGGAFELALACHYRVVSDDSATRVGLPEVKVGLFPGAGGTQRVARLMNTGDALQMLFKGDQIRAQQARTMNLVHEIAPRGEIVARARAWIVNGGKALAPWDQKDFRLPSGRVYSPAGMMVWPAANAIYRRETQDNYPAVKAIMQSVFDGLQLPFDLGLRVEARQFAKILRSPQASAMIRTLFVSTGELNKGARRPKEPPLAPRRIGIIGAGFMGASIAYVAALAGLDVVLLDRTLELAEKGKQVCHKLMSQQVMRARATVADRDALLARIEAAGDYARLSECDLVIEAVFEDRRVKADAIARAAAAMKPGAILASNTSTLPITSLAQASPTPVDFVGIHFFSPVERMPLVEIIRGEQTGPRALAVAFDFARALKKTPILVNDSRGFFANRCVLAYIREGHLMLREGVPPAMIENLARQAGMPVGPLALNDEVGLDLAWRILEATKADLGEAAVDPVQEAIIGALVNEHGRLGRKNGKGFYDYPEKGEKRLWAGLSALQARRIDPDEVDQAEIKRRFLSAQALEAARVMEEGVLSDPREADVGSILGFGFSPFTGGVLSYIDGMGADAFVAQCDALARKVGPHFTPGDLLLQMAQRGESFYERFSARAAA